MSIFNIFNTENKKQIKEDSEVYEKKSWLAKLRHKLYCSLSSFTKIFKLFDSKEIDYQTFEELLIDTDIDYETTQEIINKIKSANKEQKIDGTEAKKIIKQYMTEILTESYKKFDLSRYEDDAKKIVFFCGINGGGKTTSIAKIASLFKSKYKILLVGCDSFRAAANSQLTVWADRLSVNVFDSETAKTTTQSTIAYKAVEFANENNNDLLLIDTSGRMSNNKSLMDELKKTAVVLQKHNPNYPQEIILVLDGTLGQHTKKQIEDFSQYVKITGLIITKLDGIAKGGIIISIARKYKLPIYFIGIGEKEDDINYFDIEEFIDGLIGD